ncbi:MAG TPA: hypothetical protein VE010_03450 [Thermoanaerobaculia bacterium]|nr:hypothetical protein [Thermoanaerobaculia bacterium]
MQPFDVVARGSEPECSIVLPRGGPALQFLGISTEDPSDVGFIAPGGDGRVLALVDEGRIVEIRPDLTRTPVFSGIAGTFARSFLVDAAGNIYLATDNGRLLAIRPDGTIRAEYALEVYFMDLAADQCTLFYWTSGGIRRFDICTGTPLPDFLPGAPMGEFRLLPDGGLLRVDGDPEVVRYDAAGTLTRTYPQPDAAGIVVLAGGGRTMIVGAGCYGPLREYDLDTGALLRTFSFDITSVREVVVYNGFTAALGPLAAAHAAAAVPSLSTAMLVFLGALLALVAFRRIG